MWWTQAQKRYEGAKNTSELFQIYQPHRLRPQKMHKKRVKEREGERMLTEPQACPKRNVKPPEWLLGTIPRKETVPKLMFILCDLMLSYCFRMGSSMLENNTGFQIAFQLYFSGYAC
jgi:hypothetical protein